MQEKIAQQSNLIQKKKYLENKLKELEEKEQPINPSTFKKEKDILLIQIKKSQL